MKKFTFFALFALAFCFLIGCGSKSFTVTFNSALGSNVESQTINENETATKPVDPTREGYVFGGWTYNGVEYDFATPVTSDITLTAKWNQMFTVQFLDGDGNVIKEELVEPGKDATAPAENPTKEGFEFDGWKENFTNVQSDLTITPKFVEVEYTVIFKVFGEKYGREVKALYGDTIIFPQEQDIDGYKFEGWDNETDEVTGDMVINAIYTPIEYSLEFYLGANKFEKFTTTYNIEEGATLPTISGYGYEFEGWFDAEGNEVTTLVGEYSDKQLFAKITGDFSEVTVDPNQTALFGENVTIGGKTYTMGIGIASSLTQAASTPHTETLTIVLPAGTYTEDEIITESDVVILGPNAEVDPTDPDATRAPEAIIKGAITIAAEIDNVTIIGLKFEGNGKVIGEAMDTAANWNAPDYNHESVTLQYNIFESSLNDNKSLGVVEFLEIEDKNAYDYNLQILNNVFTFKTSSTVVYSMLYIDNVEGVVVEGNVFENIPTIGIFFNSSARGLAGQTNNVNNNVFKNVKKSGILVEWATPQYGIKDAIYNFNGNFFENIGTTKDDYALSIGNINNSDSCTGFFVCSNTFNGGSNYVHISRVKTDAPVTLQHNVFSVNPSYSGTDGFIINVTNEGTNEDKVAAATCDGNTISFDYQESQIKLQ